MADINQIITLGIGTPSSVARFITLGLVPGVPAVVSQSALSAVQTGLWTLLNVSTLTDQAGVYHYVPQYSAYPYVRLEIDNAVPWEFFSTPGKRVIASVHVFSAARSDLEALTILETVEDLIYDQPITVAGHIGLDPRLEQTINVGQQLDSGREIRHWVATYVVKVYET